MDDIRDAETEMELVMYSVKVKMKETTAGLLEHPQRVDELRTREQFLRYTLLFFLLFFLVERDCVHLALRPLLAYCTSPR
jgi:hypothetical protein